jgi:hypothetical protein
VPRIVTFRDLRHQNHSLGLYCAQCDRWGEADLDKLIATGSGERPLTATRFRCQDCGSVVDKQLRPPVPRTTAAVGYIRTG